MQQVKAQVYIGTSNVVIPGNKSSFPEAFQQTSRLHYYSSLFNSVELNSTFYKLPLIKTCQRWGEEVGKDFLFSIKLSKTVTHAPQLKFDERNITLFMERTEGLKNKKGSLLLQFPGKISLDYFSAVEKILELIRDCLQRNDWSVAVEFRNPTWYVGETYELLDEYNAAMVLHDHPRAPNRTNNKKAPVVYMRFHGPDGDYRESYSEAFLLKTANEIRQYIKKGKNVFAYFNNTIGDAFTNAIQLKQLLAENAK